MGRLCCITVAPGQWIAPSRIESRHRRGLASYSSPPSGHRDPCQGLPGMGSAWRSGSRPGYPAYGPSVRRWARGCPSPSAESTACPAAPASHRPVPGSATNKQTTQRQKSTAIQDLYTSHICKILFTNIYHGTFYTMIHAFTCSFFFFFSFVNQQKLQYSWYSFFHVHRFANITKTPIPLLFCPNL